MYNIFTYLERIVDIQQYIHDSIKLWAVHRPTNLSIAFLCYYRMQWLMTVSVLTPSIKIVLDDHVILKIIRLSKILKMYYIAWWMHCHHILIAPAIAQLPCWSLIWVSQYQNQKTSLTSRNISCSITAGKCSGGKVFQYCGET